MKLNQRIGPLLFISVLSFLCAVVVVMAQDGQDTEEE